MAAFPRPYAALHIPGPASEHERTPVAVIAMRDYFGTRVEMQMLIVEASGDLTWVAMDDIQIVDDGVRGTVAESFSILERAATAVLA